MISRIVGALVEPTPVAVEADADSLTIEGNLCVVKNIIKYLRNTKYMFLVYGGDLVVELRVTCYTDAGFEPDCDDPKVQMHSYASEAAQEAVWIKKFVYGLGVIPSNE
ncbi:hypothetical protein Tco_1160589 [Tanacetum coccineum]